MALPFEQEHHRLPVHGVVVDDEDSHARQAFRGGSVSRLRPQEAAGQRDDDLGAAAAAARPEPQAAAGGLGQGARERELHLTATA